MSSKIKTSIIIANYNGKEILKKSLESIKKAELISLSEIIVVDDNSTDDSVEFLKKNHKEIKIIKNKENIGYVGLNNAISHCKGKYILFLNNDIEMDKNCIKELIKVAEKDNSIAMAAPRLINYYNRKLKSGGTWVSRAFYNGHTLENPKEKEIPYLGVGLIKKEAVEKFGYLFDKDYFIYAEDLDLGLRLRLTGLKVVFAPKAVIYHMHAITTKKSPSHKMTFLMERNLLITFVKNLSIKNILLLSPYILAMRFLAVIKDLLTFNLLSVFSRIKAILWILFNIRTVLKKRKELQKLRKMPDNFILKIFSEKNLFRKKIIL